MPALNAKSAREAAKADVTGPGAAKSPAAEVGSLADQAKVLAEQIPGFSFEGEAPSRLSEAVRAESAASWRVTGNWVLLLLALSGAGLALVEYLDPETELQFGSLIAALVVVWVVCQVMRLTMIMGYGKVRLSVGRTDSEEGGASKPGAEGTSGEPTRTVQGADATGETQQAS